MPCSICGDSGHNIRTHDRVYASTPKSRTSSSKSVASPSSSDMDISGWLTLGSLAVELAKAALSPGNERASRAPSPPPSTPARQNASRSKELQDFLGEEVSQTVVERLVVEGFDTLAKLKRLAGKSSAELRELLKIPIFDAMVLQEKLAELEREFVFKV